MISSSILGQFKLEDIILKGYFLAPKSYYYYNEKGNEIVNYKGAAKNQINPEWFESQYADPDRKQQVNVDANFRIDWSTLNIFKKDKSIQVGINLGSKRIPLFQDHNWVDTEPIDIHDLSNLDYISRKSVWMGDGAPSSSLSTISPASSTSFYLTPASVCALESSFL
ncbi:hypothetical protein L6452_27784 [Arctium lappa]|uniref:Uncharacterized protein n=1 Tax=Arctium lappa TaxID=4217 RepID=A0ACB8ZWT2_ARCLA|nr:hypothetical protein L6452_27784 [Arctium lappa]